MSMYTYGRMAVVRGEETYDHREANRIRYRKPELAIREKLKVLREFYIVDDSNEESFKRQMERAIAENPDVHFDRVLDGFARKLISEKMGG